MGDGKSPVTKLATRLVRVSAALTTLLIDTTGHMLHMGEDLGGGQIRESVAYSDLLGFTSYTNTS